MYKKAWCTCKVVVLLIKPIVFLTFSLPSASLDLKVPNNKSIRMLIFNSYLFVALRKLSSSPCRRHLPCLCHSQQLNISQLLKKRVGLEDMSNAQEPVATKFFFLICELLMFWNRVFQQERFIRFLWFLTSLIKNRRTLRKRCLLSVGINTFEIGR